MAQRSASAADLDLKSDQPTESQPQPPTEIASRHVCSKLTNRTSHIDDLSDEELLQIFECFSEGQDVARLSAVSRKWRRVAAQVPEIDIPAGASPSSITSFLRGKPDLEHLTMPHHVACCQTNSLVLGPWCESVPNLKGLGIISLERSVQPALFMSIAAALPDLESLSYTVSSTGTSPPKNRGSLGPFRLNHLRVLHLPQVDADGDYAATILRCCPSLEDLSITLNGNPRLLAHSKLQKLKYESIDMSWDSLKIEARNLEILQTSNVMHITAMVSPRFFKLTLRGKCASCKLNPIPTKLNHLYFVAHSASPLLHDICNMVNSSCGSLRSFFMVPDQSQLWDPSGVELPSSDAAVCNVWSSLVRCRKLTCLAVDSSHITSGDLNFEWFPHLETIHIGVTKVEPFFCPQSADPLQVTWREAVAKLESIKRLQKVIIMHQDENVPLSFVNELL